MDLPRPPISIVVPVLNDAVALARLLAALREFRARGDELIVVDGGSTDDSVSIAAGGADVVVNAPRGRARQMNAGAAQARGDMLWFVHADTTPPAAARQLLLRALEANEQWGRFDVRIDDAAAVFRIIETAMNLRSRLTAIATGDQAIFVRRDTFETVGGYPVIALMEDIELSRRLARLTRPLCLSARAGASARRWRRDGVLRTVVMMWLLRLLYFLGASPARLARLYGYG